MAANSESRQRGSVLVDVLASLIVGFCFGFAVAAALFSGGVL